MFTESFSCAVDFNRIFKILISFPISDLCLINLLTNSGPVVTLLLLWIMVT